jgi:hypothetical protein
VPAVPIRNDHVVALFWLSPSTGADILKELHSLEDEKGIEAAKGREFHTLCEPLQ